MRLLITADKNSIVDGFETLLVSKNEHEEIKKVVDSSCTLLVIEGAGDSLTYEQSVDLFTASLRKIRLKGNLIIRGISFDHLAGLYKSNEINIETVNTEISKINSIQDYKNIIYILDKGGFTVDSVAFTGLMYEIKATRNG